MDLATVQNLEPALIPTCRVLIHFVGHQGRDAGTFGLVKTEPWSRPLFSRRPSLKHKTRTKAPIRSIKPKPITFSLKRKGCQQPESSWKPNCKPTTRPGKELGITNQDHLPRNGQQERMV